MNQAERLVRTQDMNEQQHRKEQELEWFRETYKTLCYRDRLLICGIAAFLAEHPKEKLK